MYRMSSIGGTTSAALSTYGNASAATAALQKALDAANAAKAPSTSAAQTTDSVTISTAARISAAEQADTKKDFATLSRDVRNTLDAHYAASGTQQPDLSEMSGRALAAMTLNNDGSFTRSESMAAKTELKARMRDDFTGSLGQGDVSTGLLNYSKQVVSQYDAMSPEERDAVGWTAATRASSQSYVDAVSGTGTGSSLFALLSSDD